MKGEDLGDPFYQFTSLLYTTISHSNEGTNLRVENINMPLLSNKKLMPFSICRHANGRDWWLICSEKLTGQYHLFLLDPNGFQFKGIQTIRNSIMPFECSEGQRLLFSPQADILAKHSNCGILLMNFDRCEGLIDFRYWQDLPFQKVPGGDIAFSATGRYLFVSRRKYY
ncbi:MAG: hypothetical protein IPH93_16425 [Saprospiraceae bacterium]|nr:hypothetical protein [Saprospiraceae bacterium]